VQQPQGPDFSGVDSEDKAVQLELRGQLEKLYLLPFEFGGRDLPENVVYVPTGMAEIKQGIDDNVIRPLVADGQITRYVATPEYSGDSFVPIAITIVASDPGSFTTTINVWGEALQRD
jgi:hypothetical protein